MFRQKPLMADRARSSWQDSNIFGYKERENTTVQKAVKVDDRDARVRNNPTFSSKVFSMPGQNSQNEKRMEVNKEIMKSTVFEGPKANPPSKRNQNRIPDHGVNELFGNDRTTYDLDRPGVQLCSR